MTKDDKVNASNIIWVIEDNGDFRAATVRALALLDGIKSVRDFNSCEAAFSLLSGPNKDTLQPPQIILLDIQLPGMSGLEAIPLFKAALPEVQILVLTVFEDAVKVFTAICAGADGYLLKGSGLNGITEGIAEARRGGAPMNGRIAKMVLKRFAEQTPPQPDYGLTAREFDILQSMVKGLTKKEIAKAQALSVHTVDFHLRHIYQKLHVNTRGAAVAKAVREHLS